MGRRFEIRNVPDGHALNFLIPRKMAEPATTENLKRLRDREAKRADSAAHAGLQFKEALKILGETPHVMTVEANEKGHLFKGIKAEHIAASLKEAGLSVSADQIVLPAPLKEVGEHEINLAGGGETGSFILTLKTK